MGNRNRYVPFYHARITRKIDAISDTCSPAPPWYDAWQRLTSASTDAERLIVCQAIRDDGRLPPEAGFFLVALQAEEINRERDEDELSELRRQLKALIATRKLAANATQTSDAKVVESSELCEHIDLNSDGNSLAETLIAAGEYQMAALHVNDQDEFNRLRNLGREYFHGPPPEPVGDVEAWFTELSDRIAECATWDDPIADFTFRGYKESEYWMMIVYPDPVEVVGGVDDGAVFVPTFELDLLEIIGMFDDPYYLSLCAPEREPSDRELIQFGGCYQGHYVRVAVFAQPSKKLASPRKRDSW